MCANTYSLLFNPLLPSRPEEKLYYVLSSPEVAA